MKPLAMVLSLLLVLLLSATASAADDEYLGLLLETRRHAELGIAEIDGELADLEMKAQNDDLLVFPTASGRIIEIDLRHAGELVPLVQVALTDPGTKAAVMAGLRSTNEKWWSWARLIEEGDLLIPAIGLENVPPSLVVGAIREQYGQTTEQRTDILRAHADDLRIERDILGTIVAEIDAIIEDLEPGDLCVDYEDGALDGLCGSEPTPVPTPAPAPSPEPSAAACGEADFWCSDPVGELVKDDLTGCWSGPFGNGLMIAEVEQYKKSFDIRTMTRWRWGDDEEDQVSYGRGSGDWYAGYPTGTFYDIGPFRQTVTCDTPGADNSRHWGTFFYWTENDPAHWRPCDTRGLELRDPAGNDYSWATETFGFARTTADVCEAAFADAPQP